MIDLKNRTRETKVYQYPRDVSAGPVRPQVLEAHRGVLNPKTGERSTQSKQISVGGVLTIPPRGVVKGLPDCLLDHPALARDVKYRQVTVKKIATTRKASVAPAEPKATELAAPVRTKSSKKGQE